MKKEDFIAMGIDEKVAALCEKQSLAELTGYVAKSEHDIFVKEKELLEKAKTELDGELTKLKNSSGDLAELKEKIAELEAGKQAEAEARASEVKQLKVDHAVQIAIGGANGRNAKAIKALLELDKAELDNDGSVKGLAEQIKKLTEAEDSSFLFGSTGELAKLKGATVGESGNDGGGGTDISNMSYSQMVQHLEQNPNTVL